MLDPKLIRSELNSVAQRLKIKNFDLDIEQLKEWEEIRKELQLDTEELQNERNQKSKSIGKTKAAGGTSPKKNSIQTLVMLVALISSGKGGPKFGFIIHLIVVYAAYNVAKRIPGKIAAANKSITGISIIGPITTNIILGGIRIPKVPPAVIVPAANLTSYLDLFIDLAAIIPSIVTEAPTIPVAAANITDTNKTA